MLGDTAEEARERSREIALAQVRPETAITYLEQVWNRDFSGYDPDGPLPDVEPDTGPESAQGFANRHAAVRGRIAKLREVADAEKLSIRDLIIRITANHTFVGTPEHVASEIDRYVQERATDGFTVVGHLTPHGLDEFTDRVIPLLQERGSYRTLLRRGRDPARPARPPLGRAARAGERMTAEQARTSAPAPIRLVTVGGGPRAAMLLERLLAHLDGSSAALEITVVDPHPPGPGRIWRRDQSGLLKLNSMAQDVTVFTDDTCTIDGPVRPGPSLIEWAELVRSGILSDVDIPDAGVWDEVQSLRGDSFPTRRLQSCYLSWFWRTTVAAAPASVSVRWREDSVTAVREQHRGYAIDSRRRRSPDRRRRGLRGGAQRPPARRGHRRAPRRGERGLASRTSHRPSRRTPITRPSHPARMRSSADSVSRRWTSSSC